MIKKYNWCSLFFLVWLSSCASHDVKLHQKFVQEVSKHNYTEAIKTAEEPKFFPEKKNTLLKLVEQGSVYYRAGWYKQALLKFDEAKDLSDALYTKSISAKIKSLFNDNESIFYGRDYEVSYIRFYQAMSHYNLYRLGKYEAYFDKQNNKNVPEIILSNKEKQFHLNAARNIFKEWHSKIEEFKYNTSATYKSDLLQGLLGGFFYEQTGNTEDKQIALSLWREAVKTLNAYQEYPSFNFEYNKKDFIPTSFYEEVKKYTNERMAGLASNKRDNFLLLVSDDLITAKLAKKHSFKISIDDVVKFSYISSFFSSSYEDSVKFNRQLFASFLVNNLMDNFEYELPYIERKEARYIVAELIDMQNKIYKIPLVLASPLSDIAYKDIEKHIDAEKAKLISRLIGEYILAGYSAYKIYRASSGRDALGNMLALVSAVSSFKLAAKAIRESNRVDVRAWRSLPGNIYLGSNKLKTGEYTLNIFDVTGGKKLLLKSQTITIKEKNNIVDIIL